MFVVVVYIAVEGPNSSTGKCIIQFFVPLLMDKCIYKNKKTIRSHETL